METKRLERIILLILALLNLFLLIVVLKDGMQRRRAERETEALFASLLEENGIEAGPELDPLQSAPAQCVVVRDLEEEERRVTRLIGKHTSEDGGGSIRYYSAEQAQAALRGTGELDMLLSGNWVERTRTPEKAAAAFFRKAGVELWLDGWEPDPDPGRVTLCCCWEGCPIYNARLDFDFSAERLDLVTGTLVFSEKAAVDGSVPLDGVTVLTRFLALLRQEGTVCSRIDRLIPGYVMSVILSGESTLTPVWRIETDTVEVYLDALTGDPVRVE